MYFLMVRIILWTVWFLAGELMVDGQRAMALEFWSGISATKLTCSSAPPPPPPPPHLKMWLTLPTLQTGQQQAGWQDSAVASFPQRKWLEVLIQSNEEHYIFKSMSPMFLLIWKWWHYFMSFPFLCNNCFTCQWHSRLLYPNRELLLKVKEVSVEVSGLSLQLHVCVNMRMCSSETVSASGLLIKLKVISFNFCRYDCWCFM